MRAGLSRSARQREDRHLFDERPIKLDGFTLTAQGVTIIGRPGIPQWKAAIDFAVGAERASGFWIGELMNYAERRPDWQGKIEQALAELGRPLTHKTLMNMGYISRAVTPKAKALAPSIAHADTVTGLDPDEQVTWMEKARTEEMTVRDLRLEIRASRRRRVLKGQAVLEGMFRVIYADPGWIYGDRPPSGSDAQQHYDGMTIEQLCALPVQAHAMPNSVLFLWTTAPMLLENPGPREVIEAWGFTPKTGMVWDKVEHGWGHYVDIRHEHLIIATRGSATPDRPTPMIDSLQTIRRGGHSEKPEEFRKIIERLYDGPYLELFARERVEGWSCFGDDARLWAQEASEQDAPALEATR